MVQVEIRDINNNIKGNIELPENIFNSKIDKGAVHSAITGYLANQRQGTHATKTRSMVSGGGKKPYKQKGTGRARHGSNRSPLFRKGGVTFGHMPRDYSVKMSRQMKRSALYKALTLKILDKEVIIIDSIKFEKPKTKEFVNLLKSLELTNKSSLFILFKRDDNILLSSQNIQSVDVIKVDDMNAYNVMVNDRIVFTEDAIKRVIDKDGAREKGR